MAAGDGLISMAPTSIAVGSGTASTNADGGVDFSAVTSLSLNGVFTGDYDNYLLVLTFTATNDAETLRYRLRSGGSDASGTDYTNQTLAATSTSVSGGRDTSQTSLPIVLTSTSNQAAHFHLYGPNLAQPTASRSVEITSYSTVSIYEFAGTHSLSTAYDSITLLASAGNVTGNIHVFGYEE